MAAGALLRRRCGCSGGGTTGIITAKRFADEMMRRDLRHAVIIGFGGVGKSTFAKMFEAQLCDRLPTVRVHLNRDVAMRAPSLSNDLRENNAILVAAARALHVDPASRTASASAVERALGGPFLLLLDGFDEVPLNSQGRVVQAVQHLVRNNPKAHTILFTRPPLHRHIAVADHVDAVLELEPRRCDQVRKSVHRLVRRPAERQFIMGFLRDNGFIRPVNLKDSCHHPHLMTWRDVALVVELARAAYSGASKVLGDDYDGSRYSLYTAKVRHSVGATLPPQARSQANVEARMALLQRLTARHVNRRDTRAIWFPGDVCQRLEERQRRSCRQLLKASIFRRHGDEVHLTNQSLSDWLIARLMVVRANAQSSPCASLHAQQRALQSSELASFIAGTAVGQRCLQTLASALCQVGGAKRDNHLLLERGLPWSRNRSAAITQALKANTSSRACVTDLLEGLSHWHATVSGARP